jgi:hypothetical protein
MTPEEQARQTIDEKLGMSGGAARTKAKIHLSAARGATQRAKTLIFAKRACPERSRRNIHADGIVRICREVFGKGNDFCQKITYRTGFVCTVERLDALDRTTGGREVDLCTTLAELSSALLRAFDSDVIAEKAAGIPGASPEEVPGSNTRRKVKPTQVAPYQQFGHLGVMRVFHRHRLGLKSELRGKRSDLRGVVVSHEEITPARLHRRK